MKSSRTGTRMDRTCSMLSAAGRYDDAVGAALEHRCLGKRGDAVHTRAGTGLRGEDHPLVEHDADTVGHASHSVLNRAFVDRMRTSTRCSCRSSLSGMKFPVCATPSTIMLAAPISSSSLASVRRTAMW